MQKRDVVIYFYLGILVLGAFLTAYLFNLQLTGFVIFGQQQTDFNLGEKTNVEYNGSILMLSVNQTSGDYTSQIFDSANASAIWNNLTWQGTGNLTFEIRVCQSPECANETFASADLNNINLSGQYLQYRVLFYNDDPNSTIYLESASPYYSLVQEEVSPVAVSLYQPSGAKDSSSDIPVRFSITGGENYTCIYNVLDSVDDSIIIGNTSITPCINDTDFSLSGIGDGDYIFNLYVSSLSSSDYETSTFSVSMPSEEEETEEEETEEGAESTVQVPVTSQAQNIVELSLQPIETSDVNPSQVKNFNLIATNTGNVPLSACVLSVGGNYASWASVPGESQGLNAGEAKSFAFSMSVPEDAGEGAYAFSTTVQCAEIIRNSEFSVNVVEKRIEFNITEVERTRADRVVVTYSLEELLNEEQTVQLQFFLYDAGNSEVGNASANQTLSARESDEFSTNVPINESLGENMTLTLTASINSQQYSVSVREPIILGAPTGFFVFGDEMGTTGNILAIVILIVAVILVYYFFIARKRISKKVITQ